jgi:hypothetical protein
VAPSQVPPPIIPATQAVTRHELAGDGVSRSLGIRLESFLKATERCEQFYADAYARSAQTYSYGALPVISPLGLRGGTKRCCWQ